MSDLNAELELILAGDFEGIRQNLPLLLAIAQIVKHYSTQSVVINRPPVSPEFADYIMITFHWKGVNESTFKNHTVEKSIRLKKLDPKKVTFSRLQKMGKQIRSKFGSLDFKTGHVKCKYTNWSQGVQTWGYFDSEATGYRIIESMGDIGGFQIDKSIFKTESVKDPNTAFDPTPKKVNIASKQLRPKAKAPIANMTWSYASITFPWIQITEILCTREGYVISNLDFLNKYDEGD